MTGIENLSEEIYKRYGAVTRARDSFLYTKKGVRITDLYRENGRAILGWKGESAFTQFKNALNRGAMGSFKTEIGKRVEKSIGQLLNSERVIFYFSNKSDALKTALMYSKSNTSIYKPWSNSMTDWSTVDSVVFAPVLPWTDMIYITAIKKEISESNPEIPQFINSSIKIPYPFAVAIARSNYNLIKALQEKSEKDWFIYDSILTKYWTRTGPYLYPKVSENDYKSFVLHCLDCEITINPDYYSPSIVPFGADKGVFTKLKNNPFEFSDENAKS